MTEKIFILCFQKKEDRKIISKIFKNYQSFVNNLYFDYPLIQLRTKQHVNYVNKKYFLIKIFNF